MSFKYTILIAALLLSLVSRQSFAQNDCASDDDCKHGGRCELNVDDANDQSHINKVCQCVDDYIGPNCDDLCLIQCQNGGTCIRKTEDDHGGAETDSGDYICNCPPTYDGPLCSIIKEKNNVTSSPAVAPLTEVSVPTPAAEINSYMSVGNVLGVVFGVVMVAAIAILLYKAYSRRTKKQVDDSTSINKQKNSIDALDNPSIISHADGSATADEEMSTDGGSMVVTTTTNNATIAMTDNGPCFVPDTTHTFKLHDVA